MFHRKDRQDARADPRRLAGNNEAGHARFAIPGILAGC
jgi:hypothetical protein